VKWNEDFIGDVEVGYWPKEPTTAGQDLDADGQRAGAHSAPGRIVEVANVLLLRATRLSELSNELSSPLPAIRAAVLARDAKELLAGKTPTTAITAIEAQHSAEIRAECHFAGVVLSTNAVESRMREVRREVRELGLSGSKKQFCEAGPLIGSWMFRRERIEARWSEFRDFWRSQSRKHDAALGGVVSRLLSTIEGHHQIDAELELLKEDRRLQNRVRWHQRTDESSLRDVRAVGGRRKWPIFIRLRRCPALLSYLGMRYLNWLLSGFGPLALASMFWLVVLAVPLAAASSAPDGGAAGEVSSFWHALQYSVFTFLGVGQPNAWGTEYWHLPWFVAVSLLMLLGLLHVGILISQLYAIASRR
jgi:hypothetical protein